MEFSREIRPLTIPDFDHVRDLAHTACGITLQEGKKAIVSSRLEKLVRRHGFGSFTDYIHFISNRKHGSEFTEFIDTLTTNHSGFWREPEHFSFLQNSVFPARRSRIRIWSAACATGEEPWNIAMCALDAGVLGCNIAATDISRSALSAAIRGEYSPSRIDALPAGWRERFFNSTHDGLLSVSHTVRNLVGYRPLNLLQSFRHLGQFDVIFCRNVMIYFDQPTRDSLVERLADQLPEGGYLLTGHSETLLRLPRALEYVRPATYRKIG